MTQVSSLGRKQEQHSRWSAKGIGRNGTFQSELREIFHAWMSWVDGVVAVGEADERSNKARGNSTFETQGYERGSHDYLGFVGGSTLLSIAAAGSRGEGGARVGAVVLLWRPGSDRDVVQIWSGSKMAYLSTGGQVCHFLSMLMEETMITGGESGRVVEKSAVVWGRMLLLWCSIMTATGEGQIDALAVGSTFKTILLNVSVHEGSPPPSPSARLLGGESEHAA